MLIQNILQGIECTVKCEGLRRRLRKRLGVGLSVNNQHKVLPCADEDVSGPRPSREIILQQFLKKHLLYRLTQFRLQPTRRSALHVRISKGAGTFQSLWRDDLRVVRCEIQIEQVPYPSARWNLSLCALCALAFAPFASFA